MQDMHKKAQKNLRLSPEARRLLALLSHMNGIGESAVIELVIRKEAKTRGLLDRGFPHKEPP